MTRNDMLKFLASIFKTYGFKRHGNYFYKDIGNDIVIAFGMQGSYYGPYCYIERGYVFPSINRHLPYPKMYEWNVNCGRIMTSQGQAISYSDVEDEDFATSLRECISKAIQEMIAVAEGGKEMIKERYFIKKDLKIFFLLGEATVNYLGLEHEEQWFTVRPDFNH